MLGVNKVNVTEEVALSADDIIYVNYIWHYICILCLLK